MTIDVIAEGGVNTMKEPRDTKTTITGTEGKEEKAGDTETVRVNGKEKPTTVNAKGKKRTEKRKTRDKKSDRDK
ncbi:hypothetical protein ACN9K5_10820, partial [Aliarcobacter butzleri]